MKRGGVQKNTEGGGGGTFSHSDRKSHLILNITYQIF